MTVVEIAHDGTDDERNDCSDNVIHGFMIYLQVEQTRV
jgi:hypothetical protein